MFEEDFVFPNVGYVTVVAWRVVDIPSTNWQSYTVIPAGTGFGPPPKKKGEISAVFFSQVEFKKKGSPVSPGKRDSETFKRYLMEFDGNIKRRYIPETLRFNMESP